MTKHATWSPSSSHRWLEGGCTAYPEAVTRLPKEDSNAYAERGTFVHDALKRHLANELPDPYADDRLTDDEAYHVLSLGEYVRQLGPGQLWLEQRVRFNDMVWGTCDGAHLTPDENTLTIIEYKNGHVDVPVTAPQPLVYAAAAVRTFNVFPNWIRVVIYQPNTIAPGPRFKQKLYSFADLEDIACRIDEALTQRQFKAGKHCRYCPLFGKCEATQDLLAQLANMLVMSPSDVPDDMLAAIVAMRRPIDDWFKTLESDGLRRLMTRKVPGVTLGASNKHRVWQDESLIAPLLVDRLGLKGVKPISPAQAEKLGAKDLVEEHAIKPRGEPILVFEDDPRANLVPARDVATVFEGVKL